MMDPVHPDDPSILRSERVAMNRLYFNPVNMGNEGLSPRIIQNMGILQSAMQLTSRFDEARELSRDMGVRPLPESAEVSNARATLRRDSDVMAEMLAEPHIQIRDAGFLDVALYLLAVHYYGGTFLIPDNPMIIQTLQRVTAARNALPNYRILPPLSPFPCGNGWGNGNGDHANEH